MNNILNHVQSQFKLNIKGDHGIYHWMRVLKIGNYLSKNTNADKEVIRLFSYLHDSQRLDEFSDPGHGHRSALFAKKLYDNKELIIKPSQLELLMYACEYHSDKDAKSENLAIMICWDSDRLDLVRMDILPDPSYLYTKQAKELKALHYALKLLAEVK